MCGKRCQNIYFIGLKKDLFGCFKIEEIRDNDNETSLKEGEGIEIETTVLHSRCSLSFAFDIYLPSGECSRNRPTNNLNTLSMR